MIGVERALITNPPRVYTAVKGSEPLDSFQREPGQVRKINTSLEGCIPPPSGISHL